MNIAFFLTPKANVVYLCSNNVIAEGIETLRESGYTAIPVIDKEGKYVGVVSEGDFLWHLLNGDPSKKETIGEILNPDRYKPVRITSTMDALFVQAQAQNFVPVVDDQKKFIGIVTRRSIIEYCYEKLKKTSDAY